MAGRAVACAGLLGDLVQEEFEAERSVADAALLPDEFDEPHPGVGVGFAYRGGQDVHQDVGHIGDHIGTAHRDHPLCLPGASPAAPPDHLRAFRGQEARSSPATNRRESRPSRVDRSASLRESRAWWVPRMPSRMLDTAAAPSSERTTFLTRRSVGLGSR